MKFILFLLLVSLPIVFSIDQISDDQTQPTTTSDSQTSTENQVEAKDVEDKNQTSSSQADLASQEETKSTETAPQTTPQETQQVAQPSTENEEKSTTSVTKTPSPITDEATKNTKTQTGTQTKTTQQNSQTYVSKDDDSSCKGLCLSGGVCKNDVCICPPGFSGDRCELVFDANESKYQTKMDAVVSKYYYTLIGFVGLVAVMVLSECCCKGGSESAPKEDIPVDHDQDQKYVDLDLEAAHDQNKNYADVEADIAPVQEVQEEQQYVEPVVHVEEEQNYPDVEAEIVQVEEEQNYVEPEVVHVEEEQNYAAEPEVVYVEEEQNYVEPEAVAQEE